MNENTNSLREMDQLPVSRAVLKNVVPTIGIIVMMLVYNYADLFFIGMTHNDYMVSAITLAAPIFMFFMAFGSLYGTGGLTLISKEAATGQNKKAKHVSSFCFWCSVATGILFMIIVLVSATPLAKLLGASGAETIGYTKDYLTYIAISAPFAVIANSFAMLARSEGKPMISMVGMLLGNVINIILDPIFILGLDMGCIGAALATAIGQIIAALYFIIYILSGKSSFSINPKDFKAGDGIAKDVFSIGIPAALVTIMMNFYQIISNAVMGSYGDLAVAAMGVGLKISLLGSSIANGVGQGIQPLIAYQVGNQNKKKFKEILKFSIGFPLSISIALSILCFVFAKPLVTIFLSEASSITMGVTFTRIILSTMWISGLVNLLSFTIQSMGVPKQANIISLARNGYVGILTVLAMSLIGSTYGVVAAQPVADIISFVIAFITLRFSIKKCFPMETNSKLVTAID